MVASIQNLSSLFLSVAILLMGHGLQQTLLPLQGQALGWSAADIGLTGSAYFFGFILGCFYVPQLIRKVGHIRVFGFCVALVIVSILALARWPTLWVWLLGRALTGAAMAGLYMILESWLNEQTGSDDRGMILSFYGVISVAALVVGQLLIVDADLLGGAALVAMLLALALAPVALTSSPAPAVPNDVRPDFRFAYQASHVGLVCVAASGAVMGLLWSSGAVFVAQRLGEAEAGARFILCMLLGGLFAQLPIGRLSDLVDRRWVLLGLALVGFGICSGWQLFGTDGSAWVLFILGALLGATAMPMYSLAIAHANDNAEGRFLQIAGAMLVANGVGATLGPLSYALSSRLGLTNNLFLFIGAVFALSALWTGYRLVVHDVQRAHYQPFQSLPRTTQTAASMDPRLEPSELTNAEAP